jgi:hypothetical protein
VARSFFIFGDTMVSVKGGAHLVSGINLRTNLGMATDQIRVSPIFHRQPVHADGFGKMVAPDWRVKGMAARIQMNLVHFDRGVLDQCIRESQGGGVGPIPNPFAVGGQLQAEGVLSQAGVLMGGYKPRFASGNHYIGLNIQGTNQTTGNWRFLYAMIEGTGPEYPLGNGYSVVPVTWTAVPYLEPPTHSNGSIRTGGFEWVSSGVVLWDRTLDT